MEVERAGNPEELSAVPPSPRRAWGVGLNTVMLYIGVAAICFALFHEDVYIGFASLLILFPGLIRASYRFAKRAAEGKSNPVGYKILILLLSVIEVCIVWTSFSIAFVGVCAPMAAGLIDIHEVPGLGIEPGMIGVGLATLVGAWAAYVTAGFLWRSRDRRKS